jgi:hypothetical protein
VLDKFIDRTIEQGGALPMIDRLTHGSAGRSERVRDVHSAATARAAAGTTAAARGLRAKIYFGKKVPLLSR